MLEPLFMRLALVASIATGVSLGVMGAYLVMRRMIFLGLVVANAATLGSAVAQAVGWPSEVLSLAAGVATAAVLGGVETGRRVSAESLMGWAYAATSSITVLILSRTTGSADTLHLLFGNVLEVDISDVVELTIIAGAVVLAHGFFGRRFLLVAFDPEGASVAGVNTRWWLFALNLAIGVVAAVAVHAIGALTTFALLTLPAMAALLATTSVRATFVTAVLLGAGLSAFALAAAFYIDLPAGAACVAMLAASVPLAALGRFRRFNTPSA